MERDNFNEFDFPPYAETVRLRLVKLGITNAVQLCDIISPGFSNFFPTSKKHNNCVAYLKEYGWTRILDKLILIMGE